MILKLVAETTRVRPCHIESFRRVTTKYFQGNRSGEGWGNKESGLPHKFTLTVASGVFDIPLGWEATIDTQCDFGVTVDNHHRVHCGALCGVAPSTLLMTSRHVCQVRLSSVEKQFYLLFRFCLTVCMRVCACVNLLFIVCCELNAKIC